MGRLFTPTGAVQPVYRANVTAADGYVITLDGTYESVAEYSEVLQFWTAGGQQIPIASKTRTITTITVKPDTDAALLTGQITPV